MNGYQSFHTFWVGEEASLRDVSIIELLSLSHPTLVHIVGLSSSHMTSGSVPILSSSIHDPYGITSSTLLLNAWGLNLRRSLLDCVFLQKKGIQRLEIPIWANICLSGPWASWLETSCLPTQHLAVQAHSCTMRASKNQKNRQLLKR